MKLPLPGDASIIHTTQEYNDYRKDLKCNDVMIIYFYADFDPTCRLGGPIDVVFNQLALLNPEFRFIKVEADKIKDIAAKFDINVVPTFVVLQGCKQLKRLEGADIAQLAKIINVLKMKNQTSKVCAFSKSCANSEKQYDKQNDQEKEGEVTLSNEMKQRLHKLINASKLMLFIKGTPKAPRCKFTRALLEILDANELVYDTFDIFSDNDVREQLKIYSQWKTYPQVYYQGQLVGGLDKIKELQAEGQLKQRLSQATVSDIPTKNNEPNLISDFEILQGTKEDLKKLINVAPVVVFMKGDATEPRCGFSRKIVSILNENKVPFTSFDILKNENIRQNLKSYSNWPTYPQLYANGKLIGGLDIVSEIAEDGSLRETLELPEETISTINENESATNSLDRLINQSRIMIFMKGTPNDPCCGFSARLIEIVNSYNVEYGSFDILKDNEVREGLKKYMNWPTYPQVYVNGKLLGGYDIIKEMHEENELEDALKA